MDSTPVELECYIEAERLAEKRRDTANWQMGMYNLSAFSVALSKALSGKKSHAKYIDKTFTQQMEEVENKGDENLTEEQIVQEREKLLTTLMTMQANFELNHQSGEKS